MIDRTKVRVGAAVALPLAAMAVLLSAPVSAAPPDATTAAVTVGPNPSWIAGDDTITYRTNAVVDAKGNTYLTARDVLLSAWSPSGRSEHQIVVEGPGTISGRASHLPPDIALMVGTDGLVVAGWVTGSVTFREPSGDDTTLDGGAGTSFYAVLSTDGQVEWARLFGGPTARADHVEIVGNALVIAGRLTGPTTIDSLPATTAGDGDAFVVGFDLVNGVADWITQLTLSPRLSPFETVGIRATDADGDSVAVITSTSNGVSVSGGGQTTSRACPSGGSCHVLTDLEAATGRPALVTVTSDTGDHDEIYTTDVQIVDDGYVTLGENRDLPEPAAVENAFITRFDAAGLPVWTRYLYGSEALEAGADLVVGHDGDIVVGVSFPDQVTLGDGPGAPVLTDPAGGVVIAEYTSAGELERYVQGFGNFAPSTLEVDATDALRVVSDRYAPGPIAFGTGPAVTDGGPVLASFPADVPALAAFHAMAPVRVLDSRTATGDWNQKLTAAAPMTLSFGDQHAGTVTNELDTPLVPYDTTAVVLNLTATDVSEMTFLTAWPTGSPKPVASNLNALAGDTISNQVTVRLGDLSRIQIATAKGSVHVVADLLGYYAADPGGSGYNAMTPTRLLDSRTSTGGWPSRLSAGQPRELLVAGANGIPSSASAVTLSVTATDTTAQTYLRVQPTGVPASHSNVAVDRGETITNLVTTRIGTDGRVLFTNNSGSVHVVADAVGYYDWTGAWFRATTPTRVLDSRFGTGGYASPWGPGTTRTIPVAQIAPGDDVVAIAANLTATDTTAMSLLTLFPAAPRPGTSNLLFTPGQTIAAAVSSGVGAGGTVSLYNKLGSANLVLDVNGYFVDP